MPSLRRKLLLTVLLGLLCLLIGFAIYLFANDRITFYLSIAICIFSLYKVIMLYYTIIKHKYETVDGTCVSIIPKLFRKYRKIKIMDDNGTESTLLLNKHSKIKIGTRYRFYFKTSNNIKIGNEYIDSALSSDCFLGYEELSEEKHSGNTDDIKPSEKAD